MAAQIDAERTVSVREFEEFVQAQISRLAGPSEAPAAHVQAWRGTCSALFHAVPTPEFDPDAPRPIAPSMFAEDVEAVVPGRSTQNQFDALVSLTRAMGELRQRVLGRAPLVRELVAQNPSSESYVAGYLYAPRMAADGRARFLRPTLDKYFISVVPLERIEKKCTFSFASPLDGAAGAQHTVNSLPDFAPERMVEHVSEGFASVYLWSPHLRTSDVAEIWVHPGREVESLMTLLSWGNTLEDLKGVAFHHLHIEGDVPVRGDRVGFKWTI